MDLGSLVAYYKLDDSSGTIVDSLNGYNSINASVSYGVGGKLGTAVSFSGVSDIITIGDHSVWTINAAEGYTMSTWSYYNGANINNYGHLFGYRYGSMFAFNTASAQLVWYNGTNLLTSNVLTGITTSTWYHFALTKDSSHIIFYYNGVNVGEQYETISTAVDPSIMTIGNNESNFVINGRIDEVGFWHKTLTPTDISTLYNNGSGKAYPFGTYTKDVVFPDTDVEGFVLELPRQFYSGNLKDILEDRFELVEIPNLSSKTKDILVDRFEIFELVLTAGAGTTRETSFIF